MTLKYNNEQHHEYLNFTDRVGLNWVEIFDGNDEFYSAVYWDLLIGMWRQNKPVRKTNAINFMKSIKSALTAGKYFTVALKNGLLLEVDNPEDARSKLLKLSPEMRKRLDKFFDQAVNEMRQSTALIDTKGPSPEEP